MASPPTGIRSAVTIEPSESTAICVVGRPAHHDHGRLGPLHGQSAADGRGDQRVDQLDAAGPEPDQRLDGGALGERVGVVRGAGGGAQPRLAAQRAAELLAEQVAQHALGHLDVDDGAAGDGRTTRM